MKDDELFDRLARLLPPQFDTLLLRARVPSEFVSPSVAPPATRATELMRWMKQARGRRQRVLDALAKEERAGERAPVAAELVPPPPALTPHDDAPRGTPRIVLFLASEPTDRARLRLGRELAEIRALLRVETARGSVVLDSRWAVRPPDLSAALHDIGPHVVHFSGHGSTAGRLMFEDDAGRATDIDPGAIEELFSLFPAVECVVLNACYTEDQAAALARCVPHVVGMRSTISDQGAIGFAAGFYKALAAGRSIPEAHKFGCVELRLLNIPEHLTPVLKVRGVASEAQAIPPAPAPQPRASGDIGRLDLVQVLAHTAGGGGSISTGYAVAPGRILTARHALFPEGATGAVEVRWYNREGSARAWRPATVKWRGPNGVDAAILACEFPPEITAAPYLLSCAVPSHSCEWTSAGFAVAGAADGEETLVPLRGRVLPLAEDPARAGSFDLGVDVDATQAQDWQGASGSPVFVGQRILGVVASAQRPFEAGRLTATATCRLLEDEGFRVAVGYVEKWKGLQKYRSQLIDALSASMEAAESLATEMKLDLQDKLRGDEAFARIVVDRLLLERLDDLVRRLSVAHRKLCERKSWSSAEAIRETAWCALPAVCDVADVQLGQWHASEHGLLRLHVATETLAEIILAASDAREVRFGPGAGQPEPLLKIQVPPPGGEIAGLEQFEREWHNYAIQKFVAAPDRAKATKLETLIKLAADQLNDIAEYHKERYYYIVEVTDPDEAGGWSSVVARLQRHYPAVVFLTLTGTDPELVRERKIRFHISDMLAPHEQGNLAVTKRTPA